MFTGGDLKEITFNHPELGVFSFSTKSDESYEVDPGGFRSADDANMITGGGDNIRKINRVKWCVEGPLVFNFNGASQEMVNLPLIAENPIDGTWTFEHISGAIWKGNGSVVGDIKPDTNNSQATIKMSGGGRLERVN